MIPRQPSRHDQLTRWVLATILFIALIVRLRAIGFGLPAINDPDELIFELGAVKMLREGTLNPGWFGHPATTTLYLLAMLDIAVFAVGHICGWFSSAADFSNAIYLDPGWVILPARIGMAIFGTGCVFLVYRLGGRLFDRRVALTAAALLAASPVHISYSQVIRSDVMATLFVLLMMLATLRFARTGGIRTLLLAAFWFGMATTTKWPFAACSVSFAAVAIHRCRSGQDSTAAAFRNLALFGLAGLIAILSISPYLALDHQAALKSVMGESQIHHVGANGGGALWNAGWYLRVPLLQALGWFGLPLAAAGIVIGRRNREATLLFLPFMTLIAFVTVTQNLIWIRWVLPLLPLLAIYAALALWTVWDKLPSLPRPARSILATLLFAALLGPLGWRAKADAAERMTDTRQAATRWADAHIPKGSRIIIEHFGFDLLPRPWSYLFPLADAGCVDARALLRGKVQYAAVEAMRNGHHNVDYGTLTPGTQASCNADYAILSQYDRYMAEASVFPQEVASYRELMARSTVVATIRPVSGRMGGPTIRILRIDKPYQLAPARPPN